jgi:hypothetical protein
MLDMPNRITENLIGTIKYNFYKDIKMSDNWNKFPISTPQEAGYYIIAYHNILYGKISNDIAYTIGVWNRMGYWVDIMDNIVVIGWTNIEPFG